MQDIFLGLMIAALIPLVLWAWLVLLRTLIQIIKDF